MELNCGLGNGISLFLLYGNLIICFGGICNEISIEELKNGATP
jgi:hypothetical protein